VPRFSEFYLGICLTTEEKAWKNFSQGKKNLSQVKENLSQTIVYILPKHPHIKKTHTNAHINTHITKQCNDKHLVFETCRKARKTSVKVRKTSVRLRKTSVRVQYTY